MTERPSAISRPMCGAALGSGGGSGLRISQTETAEQMNDRASRRIAMGAVISCTRRPVRPGPEMSAMDSVSANLLLASTRTVRSTRDGT